MELEEFLPFNLLIAFQTVLEEVLEFKLEQNCLQQFRLAFFMVYRAFARSCLYLRMFSDVGCRKTRRCAFFPFFNGQFTFISESRHLGQPGFTLGFWNDFGRS